MQDMLMLRAALFPDFKDSDTLLIWGDNSDMATLYHELNRMKRGQSTGFFIGGGSNLPSTKVQLENGQLVSIVARTSLSIVWSCSLDVIVECTEIIEQLMISTAAHQYVDVHEGLAEQILISVNEYPDDLRP